MLLSCACFGFCEKSANLAQKAWVGLTPNSHFYIKKTGVNYEKSFIA
jgi:hypothetical protein